MGAQGLGSSAGGKTRRLAGTDGLCGSGGLDGFRGGRVGLHSRVDCSSHASGELAKSRQTVRQSPSFREAA